MKQNALLEFRKLRESLTSERDILSARLKEINEALGESPLPATGSMPAAFSAEAKAQRGPRRMSAAARRKIAEAQRARWAKARGEAIPVAAPASKKKFIMSAAARRKIAEAQRRRWAERKAKEI